MELSINADRSVSGGKGAGFQFEFRCACCGKVARSPREAYKLGIFASLIQTASYWLRLSGPANRIVTNTASLRWEKSREAAQERAVEWAHRHYTQCAGCEIWVCLDCKGEADEFCSRCQSKSGSRAGGRLAVSPATGSHGTMNQPYEDLDRRVVCSNCGSPSEGGRFCPECGFDMASTHKGCPSCGAMCARTARFCPECGHGF